MKISFKFITVPVTKVASFIKMIFSYFWKYLKIMGAYFYQASDMLVKNTIETFSKRSQSRPKKQVNDASGSQVNPSKFTHIFSSLGIMFAFIIFIIIIAIGLYVSVFTVHVGSTAVVTRFGKAVREVDAGINFRIPYAEHYYIVDTGFLQEQTFGFIQTKAPVKPVVLNPRQKNAVDHYNEQLLAEEKLSEGPFSIKGNVVQAMSQKQRLTEDYLANKLVPGEEQNLTAEQVLQKLNRVKSEKEAIQDQGISLSGHVPMHDEMRYITANLSIIQLQWTLQYKIDNGIDYLFNSKNVKKNVHDVAAAIMNEIVGDTTFTALRTTKRHEVEQEVLKRTQEILNKMKLGIEVKQVVIMDALPVKEVKFAFNEVNKAFQDKERIINIALKDYQDAIPVAEGRAERIVAEANAYAIKITNLAQGQSGQFSKVLGEYLKAPKITEDRLYISTLQDLLSKTPHTIIDKDMPGVLPLLMRYGASDKLSNMTKALPGSKINAASPLNTARSPVSAASGINVSSASAAQSTPAGIAP